ncbi:hypothetical protein ER45_029360 (plasmid) [Bacillus mycoides]|nr:hypothetical protein ER45_029360 [Bacillus mycoides]
MIENYLLIILIFLLIIFVPWLRRLKRENKKVLMRIKRSREREQKKEKEH